MTAVREFRTDDIEQVVDLHKRAFGAKSAGTPQQMAAYFEDIFFRNPWRDAALPSLVAASNGTITGFLGVLPRPMTLCGQRLRVAVCTQFMVDPKHRGDGDLAGLRLLKALFAGPQELSFADGANDEARRMWQALGGGVPLFYNLQWLVPLRPARYALWLAEQRMTALRPLIAMGHPLAALADRALARVTANGGSACAGEALEEPLQSAIMLAQLPQVMNGIALQPSYDAVSLNWLLEQAARKKRHGALRARTVLDGAHKPLGWYLYYHGKARGTAEVVQLAARDGFHGLVLKRLVMDARLLGAWLVCGRLDPHFAQPLLDHRCSFRRESSWTLVHSRDAAISAAIQQGNAFLSRLEGEWWLRFLGE